MITSPFFTFHTPERRDVVFGTATPSFSRSSLYFFRVLPVAEDPRLTWTPTIPNTRSEATQLSHHYPATILTNRRRPTHEEFPNR